jgi:hypothetical protein
MAEVVALVLLLRLMSLMAMVITRVVVAAAMHDTGPCGSCCSNTGSGQGCAGKGTSAGRSGSSVELLRLAHQMPRRTLLHSGASTYLARIRLPRTGLLADLAKARSAVVAAFYLLLLQLCFL